jgi:MFS family permease
MLLQVANISAESLAWGFIYIQAVLHGASEAQLALYFIVMYGAAGLIIPAMSRPVHVGRSMAAGLLLRAAAMLIAIGVASFGNVLLAGALHGAFIALFWIPYNAVFFRYTSDEDRAGRSTALFALFAVSGALLPLLGALVIDASSFAVVLVIGALLLASGAVAAVSTGWGAPMQFRLPRAIRMGRGLGALVAAEGVWQGVFWLITQLGTLRMVDKVLQYGEFLAFLGVMSGVATVLAGRWSDRSSDRRLPLVLSACGVAVATGLVTLTFGHLIWWSLAVGVTNFFANMMMAFTFTLIAELGPGFDDSMALREFMFNVGRVAGGALVGIAVLSFGGDLRWPLAVAAAAVVVMLLGYLRTLRARATAAAATKTSSGPTA